MVLLLLLQSCVSRESCCHNCGLRRARRLPPAAPAGDQALQPHAGAVPGNVVHLAEDVNAGYVACGVSLPRSARAGAGPGVRLVADAFLAKGHDLQP